MFCSNCGTQLPDDANFCLKCGKPQKLGIQAEEISWETCEIEEEYLKGGGLFSKEERRLVAKAIGRKGVYIASTSLIYSGQAEDLDPSGTAVGSLPEYFREPSKRFVAMLNAFISTLSAEGWESVETQGRHWYSYKFRRQLRD